jgi:hypothetical protein
MMLNIILSVVLGMVFYFNYVQCVVVHVDTENITLRCPNLVQGDLD